LETVPSLFRRIFSEQNSITNLTPLVLVAKFVIGVIDTGGAP
jgi:hypothetical protein